MSEDQAEDRPAAAKPVRRPGPVLTPDTEPFWKSVKAHEMALPRCQSCGKFFFPPANFCQNCWSTEITWEPVSGRGKIFSFVTFQRLYNAAFADLLPYAVAVVELEEGPRLMSRITGASVESLAVDEPVVVSYDELPSGDVLPLFTPASGAA